MTAWDRPLVSYWDQRTDSFNRAAAEIRELSTLERNAAYDEIRDCVIDKVAALPEDLLLRAAVSMVDDLYKFVNDTVWMDDALLGYLNAFAHTMIATVRARGYVIRYIADNQFSGSDYLRMGPFDLFPRVFNAAGFVYTCPQLVALQLMRADGIRDDEYEARVAHYIDEARMLNDRIVNTCRNDSRHFVLLETDYVAGSLDAAENGERDAGALTIFRNEAPLPGTNVSVRFPKSRIED
jgi:hypothetical protein